MVQNYANVVRRTYQDAVAGARQVQTAVAALLANPSAATLAAARSAWVSARVSYSQSEAFRFYAGPIDDEAAGNPEGRINSWPLDEAYVDYVAGNAASGIIQHPTEYPALTRELLVSLNERGGESNIATGWHAVEFMLWGQDASTTGPGDRPATDFVAGAGGTGSNTERRREYLRLVTDQLVEDLAAVAAEWEPGVPARYAARLAAVAPEEALRRILTGVGAMSGPELAGDRTSVAFEERDQENEQSCFSDNTLNDDVNAAIGIQNVYLGRYGAMDGPGLDELVRARDPALDQRLQTQIQASIDAFRAIPAPFDQALLGGDSTPGRTRIAAAIAAARAQSQTLVQAAAVLGIRLTLQTPTPSPDAGAGTDAAADAPGGGG